MDNNRQRNPDFEWEDGNIKPSEHWHPITALTIYYARKHFWAEDDSEPYSAYEIAAHMYPEGSESFKWLYNVLKHHPRYGSWDTDIGFPFMGTHPIPDNARLEGGSYIVGRKLSNQYPGYLWLEKFSPVFETAEIYVTLGDALQGISPGLYAQPTDRGEVRRFIKSLPELTHFELLELINAIKGEPPTSPRVQMKLNVLNSLDGPALHYLRFLFKKETTEKPLEVTPIEKRIEQRFYAEIPPTIHFALACYRRLWPFLRRIPLRWKLATFGVTALLVALGVSAHYHEDRMYVLKTEGLAAWCSYLVSWGEDSDRFRYLSGYSLYRSGRYDDAYGVLLRLIVEEDVSAKMKADAYYTLAQVTLNQGRTYEAMGFIKRALAFYEKNYYWDNAYEAVLIQSSIEDNGNFGGAESSLADALRFVEYDKGRYIKHLGLWHQFEFYHFLREKNYDGAIDTARKAFDFFLSEGNTNEAMLAEVSLSFAMALRGEFEEALAHLRKAEVWFNKTDDFQLLKYCSLAWVAIEGPESKSMTDIESWLSTMGEDPELRFLLELALENSNQEPDNERNKKNE